MQTNAVPSFAELLKRFRLAAGLSQEELAARARLSPRGVSDLERGARTNPRPATVRLLADALGLNATDRAAFLVAAQGSGPASSSSAAHTPAPPALDVQAVHPEPPRLQPPTGTVTFLFTDIEGSTRLLQQLGPHYAGMLAQHQRLVRAAIAAHSGYEVDIQGDSFFVAFPTAPSALAAAVEATRTLAAHVWPEGATLRVRMGLHSGAPPVAGDHYVGLDVHRAARIASSGHGGQILLSAAAAELARHDLPDGIALRDLGVHRLKDLQQAERIYQAILPDLAFDFPQLKALDARPHNLPVQTTLLLGREHEVTALCTLLRRGGVRLVTLTGPGGIGKTRLSLQVAAEVLDAFPDGVWNVRLSRLIDPDLVVPTIATTLDLKDSGGPPLSEVLQGYLRDKQLLLVLDNFEQVVAAATQVGELLAACPGVKALVTSRVPLHLRGEHEFALHPLALPDPQHLPPLDRLSQCAAVALFVERARAAQADFQVTNATAPAVAAICARLDGLPLAIELAAARVKVLPPPALLTRLERSLAMLTGGARDVDERQQTMRNTLAWSYGLLSPDEQMLFRRLAVFVGGCTLEAAEAVCFAPEGAEPLRLDLFECLAALIDHGLVQQREVAGAPRFGMLYVVREYALEQLEASGEEATIRRAHAADFTALAEEAEPHLRHASREWLERLDSEQDNMHAALERSRTAGETVLSFRLADALIYYWFNRGRMGEALTWLSHAIDEAQGIQSLESSGVVARELQIKALNAAGRAALWHGDHAQAVMFLGRSLEVARAAADSAMTADTLSRLALAELFTGDPERALALMEESLSLARESGEVWLCKGVFSNMGYVCYHLGDLERSEAYVRKSLALARQSADVYSEALNVMQLGQVQRRRGDGIGAMEMFGEALRMAQRVGDPSYIAEALEYIADVAAEECQGKRAARLLGAAAAMREPLGFPQVVIDQTETEALIAPVRAAMGEEAWQAAFAAGQALSMEQAVAEALSEDLTSATGRNE